MALIETITIHEVTLLPAEGNIQVKWRNAIEKDGEVVGERDHYRLYAPAQKAEFLAEVTGGAAYAAAMGW